MASTIAAGTTSGTAIAIAGDTSGVLQLQTNGTTAAVTINTSQNVGIGTSSPAYALDVRSTTAPAIRLSRSGTAGQIASVVFEDGNATLGSGSTTRVASDAGAMSFSTGGTSGAVTGGTERMRIDSSGNLLVGATAVSRTGQSRIKSTGTQSSLLVECSGATVASGALEVAASAAPSNTSNYLIVATTSAVDKFYVYSNGNVVNANNSYGSLSDVTLKENIVDTTPKLDKINSVRVVNYNLIGDEQKQIGVIAQELETVFPAMVEIDGKTGLKQVKYSVFVPMLIKAIQELNTDLANTKLLLTEVSNKVDAQAVRIAELEGAR